MNELQLQAKFWEMAWNWWPQSQDHIWAVPNSALAQVVTEGDRIKAKNLKATGLLEGVWDLHAYWHGQFYIIETKVGYNKLTENWIEYDKKTGKMKRKHRGQKEWGEKMAGHGASRYVYSTTEQAVFILRAIFGEPREGFKL